MKKNIIQTQTEGQLQNTRPVLFKLSKPTVRKKRKRKTELSRLEETKSMMNEHWIERLRS
jgi:hypothetical protein